MPDGDEDAVAGDLGPLARALLPALVNLVTGAVAGSLVLVAWSTFQRLRGKNRTEA